MYAIRSYYGLSVLSWPGILDRRPVGPAARGQQFWGHLVITSYSIHYTKLYEAGAGDLAPTQDPVIMVAADQHAAIDPRLQGGPSYNFV